MPLFYIAIKYLPPSQAAVSQSIHPLIGMIYAYIFLGERFPKKNIAFLICAWGGVLLINFTKVTNDEDEVDSDNVKYGILCSIISLIFIATMVVCAKQITNHADPIFSPFYFSFGMFLAAVILILFQRDRLHFEHYRRKDVFLLILSCVCSYLSHSFQSYATTFTLASNLQPLSCSTPWFLLFVDIFFFNYQFQQMYFVGFAIIIFCLITPIIISLTQRLSKDKAQN